MSGFPSLWRVAAHSPPDEAASLLLGVGEWLGVNGEAVFGTRHWHTFGEGETEVATGHHTERDNRAFTAGDIRFTTAGNTLYAICLAWPGAESTIKSLGPHSTVRGDRINQVTMLGCPEPLEWSQDKAGLKIKTPAEKSCKHAYTFKIALKASV